MQDSITLSPGRIVEVPMVTETENSRPDEDTTVVGVFVVEVIVDVIAFGFVVEVVTLTTLVGLGVLAYRFKT